MQTRILNSNSEEVIWSFPLTKGFFKKTVVQERQVTNLRVIQGEGYIGLSLLDDIVVMNQRRVSDSSYTSVGGGRYSPRIGTGKSTSRTVGDVTFIHKGKPFFIFYQIPDPQGVARLAKAARKRLLEDMKTAEKMNKARLQEGKQRREQPQQKERISLTITSASNKVTTCPRCSNTNTAGSKYCNNCGFRFADAAKEEKGRIMNQRPLSLPSSSSHSMIKAAEQNVGKFMTWESPTHGVKINYPSNWRVEKGKRPSTLVLFKSPKEGPSDMIFENVVISLYDIAIETLEQLVPLFINQHRKNFHNLTLIESVPTTLGGRQAHRLVFDSEGKRLMTVFVVEKNKVYEIGYGSIPSKFDSYLPIVQKMLDSFEITANR
jgi:hypothetical protein